MHERPHHPPPRRRARVPSGALAVLVTIGVLGGCSAPDAPAPAPAPAPSPSLTQEQQAAAVVEDLFSRFEALDPSDVTKAEVEHLLTGEALTSEEQEIEQDADAGRTYDGEVTVRDFSITSSGVDDHQNHFMVGQACLDVSGTRVLGPDGQPLFVDRPPTVSMQMKAVEISDGTWRLSEIVRNDSAGACS